MKKVVRVLVVEDDYLVSEMITGLLGEMDGYRVTGVATTGLEAVELTKTLAPDVVLMDIRMPDMDGIQAAQQIRDQCPTPVVILSAYETIELVEQASAAGVGSYLVKPPSSRELERAFITTMARFSDMMALRQANQELLARNEELDAFGYTVAHDLQNPLTLLIGYAEAVNRYYDSMSLEEVTQCLQSIEQAGHKMSRIVDQLLLLARAHDEEIELEPLNMGSIVSEAQKYLSHMIRDYNAVVHAPEQWPAALGHPAWIEEVWYNYISNAIKYGDPDRPVVELGADPLQDGIVRFWVRDNGRGVGTTDREMLFAPFTRLGNNNAKGHGIGLSIVRRIVEKLGGQANATSLADGGSEFYFTLPAAESAD